MSDALVQGGLLVNLRVQVRHWALPPSAPVGALTPAWAPSGDLGAGEIFFQLIARASQRLPKTTEVEKKKCQMIKSSFVSVSSRGRDMQRGTGMQVWVSGAVIALTLITAFTCCFDFTGLDFNARTLRGINQRVTARRAREFHRLVGGMCEQKKKL